MVYRIGEEIGPYRLTELIGSGGTATIYKAYQARLDRYVALKVLHQAYVQDPNFLSRFEREARIVARLDHPHIVPIYDYDSHDGRSFLVMKFIQGTTLKDVMRKGLLPIEEIVRIMSKVADALTYAHQQCILHRDIKPSNILLDQRGEPYLTDFGMARITQTGQSTLSVEMLLGTPHYISPEQAQGHNQMDTRADVYSLGVMLYELVTGQVPFNGDSPVSIAHKHIYTQPPLPSSLNSRATLVVESVLIRALEKEPAARYDTPNALIQAFRQAYEIDQLVSRHNSPTQSVASSKASENSLFGSQRPASTSPTRSVSSPFKRTDKHHKSPFGLSVKMSPSHSRTAHQKKSGNQLGNEIRNFKQEIRTAAQNLLGKEEIKPFNWRPGATWRTAPNGVQGFFTDGDIADMESKMSTEDRVRWRVEQKLKARTEFITSMTVMSLIILMLWLIWALTTPGGFMWPIIASFGMLIGMVAVSIDYYSKHGPGAARREEHIQREVARELERQRDHFYNSAAYGKLKNEDLLDDEDILLDEDGELSDSFMESWEERQRRHKR